MKQKRVVITGMSINTPIGDNLDTYLENLLAGKSAITKWNTIDSSNIYSKIGGDLGNYDVASKIASYEGKIPETVYQALNRLAHRFPTLVSISMLAAVDAFLDAGYIDQIDPDNNIPTVISGHNLTQQYSMENHREFLVEPDFIDGLFAVKALDTNHVGLVSEVLQLKGPGYTVGGACASGNMALRCAFNEVRHNNHPIAIVVAPPLNLSRIDIHGMALVGAISIDSFNDTPELASRAYDTAREGFVPSHGAGALILEDLDHALQRGARIYAEILGVESSTDGSHLPQPSREGQARLMKRLLEQCEVRPEEVDFICAHGTSTPLGDLTELNAIKDAFGEHAYSLKVNAPKSMLGHACWAAALIETVAAVLQMNKGELHPSINIDNLDPEVDLDVCPNKSVVHNVNILMKNSFGFGGINSISLIKKFNQ